MRAERLVSIMLLLQTRGKMTASALAEELAVSRRTILRDVDALSLAGIPVYTEGGHGGGIALDEAYRTRLTGLNTPEVQALFVTHHQQALRDVGLNDAADQLVLKLLASLPTAHQLTVEHIRQRLMIDPTWWWHDTEIPLFWDALQRAVYEDRVIEVTYEHYRGEIVERVLEPYSLVNKSSYWYLVARRDEEFRTYRVSRFLKLHVRDQTFTRLPDFGLQQYWETHLEAFVSNFAAYTCTLRIHPDRVPFVKWLVAGRWRVADEVDQRGWMTFDMALDSEVLAAMLVFGLGTAVEVVTPQSLAEMVVRDARTVIQHLEAKRSEM